MMLKFPVKNGEVTCLKNKPNMKEKNAFTASLMKLEVCHRFLNIFKEEGL